MRVISSEVKVLSGSPEENVIFEDKGGAHCQSEHFSKATRIVRIDVQIWKTSVEIRSGRDTAAWLSHR